MSYEIRVHPKAAKEFIRLSKDAQRSMKRKLKELSRSFGKPGSKLDIRKMRGKKKEPQLYRLRVGEYRIVFEFSDNVIWIARISQRRDSYRGL